MKNARSFALALLFAAAAAFPAHAASYDAGQAAYRQNQIAEARSQYAAVAADPAASQRDRAGASRELGRLAWLIDGDAAEATRQLRAALAVGAESCQSGAVLVRVLREAGRTAEAAAEGARLAPSCDDPAEAVELGYQILAAELDRAAADPAARAAAYAAANRTLAGLGQASHGDLDTQGQALQLAILSGDAPGALAAWKGYFWLVDSDTPQGFVAYRGRMPRLFEQGAGKGATVRGQLALLDLLIRAGFDETAERFAAQASLAARANGDPAWIRAQAYFHFVDAVRAETLAMNRTLAHGGSKGDLEAFRKRILALAGELTHESDPQTIKAALERDYGLYGSVGETGGYPSLHVGHLVQDDRHQVDQFARQGSVRFVVLDNMLGNGFESWLWDGSAMAGGWSEDGVLVVQVRPAYTPGPINAFSMVGDTPARKRAMERIASLDGADLQAAQGGALVPQAGVTRRLRLQAIDAIADMARAKAGPNGDLRTAFLAEFWRVSVEQSIFDHEGRHALDQAAQPEIGKLKSEELEFRAKLSELELGEVPRLSLYQIDGDLLGGDTPHGLANARIVTALRDWIQAHPGEVAGYEAARPALSQIDRLSDAQIKAVAASLDPWAKK